MSRRKTKFIAIAACAANGIIGSDNQIPWHVPADFKWFKKKTLGNAIVMGRKTFESIGKPLPGRTTIVLSRTLRSRDGIITVRGVTELLSLKLPESVFIAGGGEIYSQCLPICRELLLTIIKEPYLGDTFFPDYEHLFPYEEIIEDETEFTIVRYFHKNHGGRMHQPRIFQRLLRPGWGLQPKPSWIPTPNSEALEGFGYLTEKRVLKIKYKHGKIYTYFDVPSRIFYELRESESRAQFISKQIKDNYSVEVS